MRVRTSQALNVLKTPVRELRASYRELTGPLRGLPAALIIGAQRSGTTSLFRYLTEHPVVLRPLGKESHYFDLHYGRGVRWYRGRFPFSYRLRSGAMTLDASPYYLLHPLAPQRAAQLLPGVKLLAILRNPVERAFSHYQKAVREGREALSFADAIDREAERLAGEEERLRSEPNYYSFNHHCCSYTLRGRYVDQLRRWVEHFPRERLMVVQSERMFREPAAVTAEVHQFLGLRPHLLKRYTEFYRGNHGRGIPPDLRSKLVDYFEPYNRELYRWLGEEFDWT